MDNAVKYGTEILCGCGWATSYREKTSTRAAIKCLVCGRVLVTLLQMDMGNFSGPYAVQVAMLNTFSDTDWASLPDMLGDIPKAAIWHRPGPSLKTKSVEQLYR